MSVTVAKNAGFCFGVKRAVDKVCALAGDPINGRIYTVGSLIHNPHIVHELESMGVRVISPEDFDRIASAASASSPVTVVIRTHGVEKCVSDRLAQLSAANPFFRYCDMTCPFVKKIHGLVRDHADKDLIVLGNREHPEVRGIISYSEKEPVVVSSYDELKTVNITENPVVMVSQTTQSTEEWKKCKLFLQNHYTNAEIFDTICSTTENRQSECDSLSRVVDLMLVIGGKESSNTNKLYRTAKANLENTFLIEDVSELRNLKFLPFHKVGITAGASTPGGIIQEVENYMENKELENGAESFAEMLEGSLKTLNTGDVVTGVISAVTAGELHIDLGAKVTGIIPFDEVTDDSSVKLSEVFKPGDEVEAFVIKVSDRDGVATLSKKKADSKNRWRSVLDAYNNGETVEGVVSDVIKGGVLLNVEGNKLFVPASQTGVPKSGDMNALLGTAAKAKIIEINEGKKRAVASIRKVLSEERKAKEAEFWANIEVGKVYEGPVKSLTSYGAFVDLGGVDGMVHSSELSWTRIKNPAEVVSIGEVIRVFVKDFDPEKKRISLGYKTEETNPWIIFTTKYSVGDTAEVKVVNLMPFGAFAEVVPGVDGLIHISQIADHKIGNPAEVLSVGDVVNVRIIGIDNDNHQISLSIRSLLEDDAEVAEEADEEVVEEAAEEVVEEVAEEAASDAE